MNENKFIVLCCIRDRSPIYLRQIVKETGIPYGTVQNIIYTHSQYFDIKQEGKQKYYSFKNNTPTQLLLKQLSIEEKQKYLKKDMQMDSLDLLESQSIYILREAYANFKNLCMLWSIGKDSTVLLWLAQKAFCGHVPFPLVHIDTAYKIPAMITYRDKLAMDYNLEMIYGQNKHALNAKKTFPDGKLSRIQCCMELKSRALRHTLDGSWPRWKLNFKTGTYVVDKKREAFTGVIVGIRSDEEGSRSKERYFSPRDKNNDWDVGDQPPELWNQFKTDFLPGTHLRIHPLLDWTETDIWRYIEREKIPIIDLYFDNGKGERYRSLGCYPCTKPVKSKAKNVRDIITELESGKFAQIAERSGREQDKEDRGGLEQLRRSGYM